MLPQINEIILIKKPFIVRNRNWDKTTFLASVVNPQPPNRLIPYALPRIKKR